MRRRNSLITILLLAIFGISTPGAQLFSQVWQPLGPDGGTVRSLTLDPANPDRIFLGTSAGRIYLSSNNGVTWSRFAHLGAAAEMVLDHVVIDPVHPRNIFVAAWNAQTLDRDGEIFRSKDAGRTWDLVADMHGKSVRALSMASSDPKVLVAGALDGIYRTRDGGDNWERISPEHHAEIKNIESIAIDPLNPDVIYAGTWHLPWKTEDGGKTWHNIKKGVIDDSDVFSVVIDSTNPANVFISACSGIYRSENAGELFRKIQGIPYSARRTRMLKMDPGDHNVVYAGTTEGLWKSTDGGATWKRTTGANVIINDVLIDPRRPSRVLLATDRSGVLASDDGGITFVASNRGFTHRQVATLLIDSKKIDSKTLDSKKLSNTIDSKPVEPKPLDARSPGDIYAGLLNDKEFGGVFKSTDAGQNWKQISEGLEGRDIFALQRLPGGSLLAGTDRGIFLLKSGESRWVPANTLIEEKSLPDPVKPDPVKPGPVKADLVRTNPATKAAVVAKVFTRELTARINALEIADQTAFAATSIGLLTSSDAGQSWHKQDLPALKYVSSLAVADRMVVAANRNVIAVSVNAGESWLTPKPLDPDFIINSVSIDGKGNIWLAAREGIFRSSDVGDTWKRITSLRLSNVMSVQFDERNQRILATGAASMNVFESTDNGRNWTPINAGWLVRNVRPIGDRLLAITPFDGIVIQPEPSTSTQASAGNGNQ
jgi:photosystem II stability/assembly factor-like uncharacterized protein